MINTNHFVNLIINRLFGDEFYLVEAMNLDGTPAQEKCHGCVIRVVVPEFRDMIISIHDFTVIEGQECIKHQTKTIPLNVYSHINRTCNPGLDNRFLFEIDLKTLQGSCTDVGCREIKLQ